MVYQILEKDGKAVSDIPCEDKLSAERWALKWARAEASADQYLVKFGNAGAAHLFRTAGGQWYVMND